MTNTNTTSKPARRAASTLINSFNLPAEFVFTWEEFKKKMEAA